MVSRLKEIKLELSDKYKLVLDQIKRSQALYGGVYYTYIDCGIGENGQTYSVELELDSGTLAFSIEVEDDFLQNTQKYLISLLIKDNIHIYDDYEDFEEALEKGEEREKKKINFIKTLGYKNE